MNYYNEYDKHAASWLRELIAAGLIPAGHVDERSIVAVQPAELAGFTQCHFFAGIGGWSLALQLAGWDSSRPVWSGSCPCQPYSVAGKQEGNADARDLWPAFARLIRECKPPVVFGEQVEGAVRHGWLDRVCGDLEAEGYACGSAVLGAHSVGAPHIRQRLFWLADAGGGQREQRLRPCGDAIQRSSDDGADGWSNFDIIQCRDGKARRVESGVFPLVAGLPRGLVPSSDPSEQEVQASAEARVMRLRGYGNAICPQTAQAFIKAFLDHEHENMHQV